MIRKKVESVRCLTIILLIITVFLSTSVTANAAGEGEVSSVSFGDYLKGIENKQYTVNRDGSVLLYNSDGSTYVENIKGEGVSKRRWMILTNKSTGEKNICYCVEFSAKIKTGMAYTGGSQFNSAAFFKNLPKDSKKLILAVLYYGHNGKNSLPVSGVNSQDYYFATQIMIWEAQQQLRVIDRDENGNVIGTKLVDAHGMSKDFFYRHLKGRAAEKCYNYIVENMNDYFVIPEFMGESPEDASALTLKYNMETKKWYGEADDSVREFDMNWNESSVI